MEKEKGVERDDGGPAFPKALDPYPNTSGGSGASTGGSQPGMTLRDWFAGQALAALGPLDHFPNEYRGEPRDHIVARAAYMYADALLTARK